MYQTYILVDPRDQQIRYVGKTKQPLNARLSRHTYDARELDQGGGFVDRTYRANWLRSVMAEGLIPEIKQIHTYKTLEEVNAAEVFLIKHIRIVKKNLTNTTSGGDGGVVARKPAVCDDVVIAEYVAGMTSRQISKKYHTCRKRVLNLLKQYGVALRPSKRVK